MKILTIFYIADRVPHAISSYRPGSAWRPHFQVTDQATDYLLFINIQKQTHRIVQLFMVVPYNVSKLDYIRQFSYTSRLKSLQKGNDSELG